MNIFIAFNDNFVLPTKVMLKSLIRNNSDPLHIFVVYSSLLPESINSIKDLENDRVTFKFIQFDDSFLKELSIPSQFSKETYYRLFAHRIFSKEIDKVLWLDGDMIINKTIAELYNLNIGEKLFAAVENCNTALNEDKKKVLQMPPDSRYVNTGVLLLNLKNMRESLDDDKIIQYLTDNQSILTLADQDVFNGLLHNHFFVLNSDTLFNYFARYITKENKPFIYRNAKVIHYCGIMKPWKKGYDGLGFDLWWKYGLRCGAEYWTIFKDLLLEQLASNPISIFTSYRKHFTNGSLVAKTKLLLKKSFPNLYFKIKEIYFKFVK